MQSVHALVHSGNEYPHRLPGEAYMTKAPLRVSVKRGLNLSSPCRAHLSHVYLIDFRSKVAEIGSMTKESVMKLLEY